MAEVGDVVDGLSGGSPKGKGKGKKSQTKVVVTTLVVLVAGVVGYYLYKQHAANTAAAATDTTGSPSTVDTTPSGDAGIATGGSTPGTETGDPFQVPDPNSATGESYGQILDDLESQITTDNASTAAILSSLDGLGTEISTIPGANTGSQVSPGNSVPASTNAAWMATVEAALVKDGLSADEAKTQVNDYLNGAPLTNGTAAQGIANQLSIIGAPVSGLKNIVVQAGVKAPTTKSVTSGVAPDEVTVATPSVSTVNDAAALNAQKKAAAVVAADKGTPGEAQAQVNLKRATATVASRK